MEFEAWPSITRLNKDAIYTEKINGSNAAVVIEPYTTDTDKSKAVDVVSIDGDLYGIWAQSRKRFITPGDDNFAFALWVYDNASALVKTLGVGRHFGEWWGKGIQGGYGLKDERRFSLFNTKRWKDTLHWQHGHALVPQLYMVPIMLEDTFSTETAKQCVDVLRLGSWASPGFMQPEGVVVFHTASQVPYKTFLENDDIHKWEVNG
jgi:hypothetical protein